MPREQCDGFGAIDGASASQGHDSIGIAFGNGARAGLERLSGEVTPLLEVMRSYDTSFHALGRRSSVAQASAPAEGLARQTERALRPSVAAGVRRLANVGGEALRRLKGALVRASPTS